MCRAELLAGDALSQLLPIAQHALTDLLSDVGSETAAPGLLARPSRVIAEDSLQLLLGVLELLAADVGDVSSPRARQVGSRLTAPDSTRSKI